MNTPTVAFSLAIPPTWSELDLRPETRDRSIAMIVRDRVEAVPELGARRADLTAYLRSTAREAWDIGCRYCGTFIEAAEDGIVPGSVTVAILPPAPANGGSALDDIVVQLRRADEPASGTTWRTITTVELEHAGPGARSLGVESIEIARNTPPTPMVIMRTFVPFEGGVALIVGGSPAIDVQDSLLELFDAVTNTFRLQISEPLA